MEVLEVTKEDVGVRLDVFCAEQLEAFSRSGIKKLIDGEHIWVNEAKVKAGYALRLGDKIEIDIPKNQNTDIEPQNIPIDIVYQDDDLAVIDKRQGMVVHPAVGHYNDTLVNALMYHFNKLSKINGETRPGIVHRLDRDTSGLMLVAKNDFAHRILAEQIASKKCMRSYIALCEGTFKEASGRIETHICRDPKDRKKMAVSHDTKDRIAITNYFLLEQFEKYALVKFVLETGRTHQIRVHAQYIHHNIVGDPTYGSKTQKFKLNGQLLHSQHIEFTQPTTKKHLAFDAALPDYFLEVLDKLRTIKFT